ncbi:hypothetical protein [Propionivibrio sp.]|uniref:hypothetical protein n=1 Tax=Propionivibrio sp. TaxID=2212460 RepID=UPI003BEFC56C
MTTKNKTPSILGTDKEQEARSAKAEFMMQPEIGAALVVSTFTKSSGLNCVDFIEPLIDSMKDVRSGNMVRVESMLLGQAVALESIFVNLAQRAAGQDQLSTFEVFLKMAMRAQSQSRATLETLAAIKNPPVCFARQANVTTGPMQVNNGTAAPRTQEKEIPRNKVLEAQHGNYLDTPATGATIGGNQALETVGAIDRAEVGKR